jgi:hypothetical protein
MSEGIWVPPGGSADPPRREEPTQQAPAQEEITPEQLAEAIRRMRISDLLLSTLSTLAQLGYAKLEPASRDLAQARLAIEALRALMPVLEGEVEDDALRDFRQVLANLQLAYASAVDEGPRAPDADESPPAAD